MFTDAEVLNLVKGVERFGEGKWARILETYKFDDRTSVDLKDKWRNLQKPASTVKVPKGECSTGGGTVCYIKGSFTITVFRRTFRFLRFSPSTKMSARKRLPKWKCPAVFENLRTPTPSTLEKMSVRTLIVKDP